MSSTIIEQRLQGITKILKNSQQVHVPSSAVSTMIPTPGLPNYGNKSSAVSQGNTMMSASVSSMMTQAASSMGNMIANANGSIGINQIGSFNSPTGITAMQFLSLTCLMFFLVSYNEQHYTCL